MNIDFDKMDMKQIQRAFRRLGISVLDVEKHGELDVKDTWRKTYKEFFPEKNPMMRGKIKTSTARAELKRHRGYRLMVYDANGNEMLQYTTRSKNIEDIVKTLNKIEFEGIELKVEVRGAKLHQELIDALENARTEKEMVVEIPKDTRRSRLPSIYSTTLNNAEAIFSELLESSDMKDILEDEEKQFLIIAPNDLAFAKIETLDGITSQDLDYILKGHIAIMTPNLGKGWFSSILGEEIQMMNGEKVLIEGNVIQGDIPAGNGIIHITDSILKQPSLDLQMIEIEEPIEYERNPSGCRGCDTSPCNACLSDCECGCICEYAPMRKNFKVKTVKDFVDEQNRSYPHRTYYLEYEDPYYGERGSFKEYIVEVKDMNGVPHMTVYWGRMGYGTPNQKEHGVVEFNQIARQIKSKQKKGYEITDVEGDYDIDDLLNVLPNENPGTLTVHRKGYTTKKGVKVPPSIYEIEDKGEPGRGEKLFDLQPGRMRAFGYSLSIPAKERREAIAKAVDHKGNTYASIIRRLNAIRTLNKNNEKQFKILDSDIKWMQKHKKTLGALTNNPRIETMDLGKIKYETDLSNMLVKKANEEEGIEITNTPASTFEKGDSPNSKRGLADVSTFEKLRMAYPLVKDTPENRERYEKLSNLYDDEMTTAILINFFAHRPAKDRTDFSKHSKTVSWQGQELDLVDRSFGMAKGYDLLIFDKDEEIDRVGIITKADFSETGEIDSEDLEIIVTGYKCRNCRDNKKCVTCEGKGVIEIPCTTCDGDGVCLACKEPVLTSEEKIIEEASYDFYTRNPVQARAIMIAVKFIADNNLDKYLNMPEKKAIAAVEEKYKDDPRKRAKAARAMTAIFKAKNKGLDMSWDALRKIDLDLIPSKKPAAIKNPIENMWMTVTFPENTEEVWNIQMELSKKGITFDTGTSIPSGGRDWELDWSLEGATTKEVLEYLNDKGVDYTMSNIREVGYYPDGSRMENWRRNPMPKGKTFMEWAKEEDAGHPDMTFREWAKEEAHEYADQQGHHEEQYYHDFLRWAESEIEEEKHTRNPLPDMNQQFAGDMTDYMKGDNETHDFLDWVEFQSDASREMRINGKMKDLQMKYVEQISHDEQEFNQILDGVSEGLYNLPPLKDVQDIVEKTGDKTEKTAINPMSDFESAFNKMKRGRKVRKEMAYDLDIPPQIIEEIYSYAKKKTEEDYKVAKELFDNWVK